MMKIKEMSAKSGVSFEKNGVWYKTEFSMTIDIDEKDRKSKEAIESIKETLWEEVNSEVDNQVDAITS